METTLAKARAVRGQVDRVVRLAKKQTDFSRRSAGKILGGEHLLGEFFSTLPERYGGRISGFSRIVKLGPRASDAAQMAILELVGEDGKRGIVDTSEGKGGDIKGESGVTEEKVEEEGLVRVGKRERREGMTGKRLVTPSLKKEKTYRLGPVGVTRKTGER